MGRSLRSVEHRVLARLLKEIRKEVWPNQKKFAGHMGWDKSVVERIEAGHQIPDFVEARRWAIGCRITYRQFVWRFEMRLEKELKKGVTTGAS